MCEQEWFSKPRPHIIILSFLSDKTSQQLDTIYSAVGV